MGRTMERVRAALAAVLVCAAAASAAACGSAAAPTCGPAPAGSCTRILFVGNSYTYVNDLPAMVSGLGWAGGHQVETRTIASGGATLSQHAGESEVGAALGGGTWSVVVLQEQSEIPAVAFSRTGEMFPAARTLAARIRGAGATPMLFMTWGHRDGLRAAGLPDYESMQLQIDDGYLAIARELDAPVAPVGYTWFVVRRQDPQIGLWAADGSHPSTAGTYLAACVFYATLFRQSPEGSSYRAGLAEGDARILQAAAARAVLSNAGQWGLR